MTPADHAIQQQREQAAHDLEDIAKLRESQPFQRYFVRRMNERHAKLGIAFKYDKLSHEDREVTRRLVLEYEDIAKMLGKDEDSCQKLLAPASPIRMPGTQGNS